MPDRAPSDSQQAPADRNKQRSTLLRVAAVVGLPILSVVLGLPIWFTLLLLVGLAVALLFRTQRKQEPDADAKKAWTHLVAGCVRLRAAYEALKQSPADAAVRARFLTTERACISLLNSHAGTDWGPDSGYAARVRKEITELSAAARAECATLPPAPEQIVEPPGEAVGQDPTPGDVKAAAPAGRPSSPAAHDTATSAELQGLLQTSEGIAVQIGRPVPAAVPEPLPTAAEQSMTSATEGAALPPEVPAQSVPPEAPAPAEQQVSTAASRSAALQPYVPALAAWNQALPPQEQAATTAGKTAAPQPDTPAPPAPAEVPTHEEMLDSESAVEATTPQSVAPTPAAPPGGPVPTETKDPVSAVEKAGVQPIAPTPSVEPDVPPAAREQGSTPASEGAEVLTGDSTPAARLDASCPAERRLMPLLWLSGGVEDAAAFYVSVFKNSRVVGTSRYPEGSHARSWSVKTATVSLDGQELLLLNGGAVYRPPETFQLLVRCADQAEVDYFWERLLAGGGEECAGGWLKDRFGVSWQVVPEALMEYLTDPDPQRVAHATEAMFAMKKIDIARLRQAVGEP